LLARGIERGLDAACIESICFGQPLRKEFIESPRPNGSLGFSAALVKRSYATVTVLPAAIDRR